VGSIGAAAIVAKLAFVVLLALGIARDDISPRTAAVFGAVGLVVWLALPRLAGSSALVTPALAVVDVALVFAVFKRDIRIG
jgi:hypothetical protein